MSNFHGMVKDRATMAISASYRLKDLDPPDLVIAVLNLVTDDNYIYPYEASFCIASFSLWLTAITIEGEIC